MIQRTASERVRDRVKDLVAARPRGFKKLIAETLGVAPSTITPWVSGEVDPPLDHLERICALAGVRLAEVVAADDSTVRELNPDEAAILRALRQWPLSVTRALCQFVGFFADEPPAAGQTRKMHELWRHLDQRRRDQLYGFAAQLSEGLPPDLIAKLFEELSAESKAAVGKQARRTK